MAAESASMYAKSPSLTSARTLKSALAWAPWPMQNGTWDMCMGKCDVTSLFFPRYRCLLLVSISMILSHSISFSVSLFRPDHPRCPRGSPHPQSPPHVYVPLSRACPKAAVTRWRSAVHVLPIAVATSSSNWTKSRTAFTTPELDMTQAK